MNAATLAVTVLLAIAVLVSLICCAALVIVKDVFSRMHFLAPITCISMPALLAAVVVQEGWGQATLKTILVLFVLLMVNAVLTHATARAARIREFGHWLPNPKENIPGASTHSA